MFQEKFDQKKLLNQLNWILPISATKFNFRVGPKKKKFKTKKKKTKKKWNKTGKNLFQKSSTTQAF